MNLYEYEGKKLLSDFGINVPKSQLISSPKEKILLKKKFIGKAQVLFGGRGKKGLITDNYASIFSSKIEKVLLEEFVESKKFHYLSITYDTETRSPILLYSDQGGVDIEEIKNVQKERIDILTDKIPTISKTVDQVSVKLWELFKDIDARLVEINPLAETPTGLIALDAKIILDDDALFRHEDLGLEKRTLVGNKPSPRELEANSIDKQDHRGSAGSSYIDLEGDIAIIAAGGGGSVVNMDALLALGGKPANYTEHSGNPPAEKVEKLTKVVLSKPGLNGLWFVGATANFTDMVETLTGFVNGLRSVKPKIEFPIVIRRGGPRWPEAKKMLEEVRLKEGFDLHIFGPETPMTSTAKIIVDLVQEYKNKHEKTH